MCCGKKVGYKKDYPGGEAQNHLGPMILNNYQAEVSYQWGRGRKVPLKINHKYKAEFGCRKEEGQECRKGPTPGWNNRAVLLLPTQAWYKVMSTSSVRWGIGHARGEGPKLKAEGGVLILRKAAIMTALILTTRQKQPSTGGLEVCGVLTLSIATTKPEELAPLLTNLTLRLSCPY